MRLFRRRKEVELPSYTDDGTLPVLVRAADPAVADSTVLAGLELPGPVLLRHHLVVPAASVAPLREVVAQDGYGVTLVDPGPPVQVRVWRTQQLTALSASQERSRMAGLAQRLGGDVDGWDACGPAPAEPDPGR